MDNIDRQYQMASNKKRLDQYKSFLNPTLADDQTDYYGPIRPLLGAELSVAVLENEDLLSFVKIVQATQEMLENGQIGLALFLETTMTSELKLTMSKGGLVVDNIFSNKMEYSQTQTVHEYQHPVERKRGFLGGRKPPSGGQ